MKYIVIFIVATWLLPFYSKGQSQQSAAVHLAQLHARKMKDTLGLSQAKRQEIFHINMGIFNRKKQARLTYANNSTKVLRMVRVYEKQRDSLYRIVLPSPTVYQPAHWCRYCSVPPPFYRIST